MIEDVISRTIKCDSKGCDKSVTFNPQVQEEIAALPDWLRTFRNVNLGNGAKFGYCSDTCEVDGAATGAHNVPEPPTVQGATEADVKIAAANVKAAESMKTKNGPKIVLG